MDVGERKLSETENKMEKHGDLFDTFDELESPDTDNEGGEYLEQDKRQKRSKLSSESENDVDQPIETIADIKLTII